MDFTRPRMMIATLASLFVISTATAQDQIPTKEGVAQNLDQTQFSPYAGRSYPTKVLWGDTHLHTAVSVDAGTMCRLGQEEALRFAPHGVLPVVLRLAGELGHEVPAPRRVAVVDVLAGQGARELLASRELGARNVAAAVAFRDLAGHRLVEAPAGGNLVRRHVGLTL